MKMVLGPRRVDKPRIRDLREGDWVSDDGWRFHRVLEVGVTCLLVGDTRPDAQVVDVIDPDAIVLRLAN